MSTKDLHPGLGSGALREALTEIGNRAGAPTMHYAPNMEREEQRESLNWIAERVRAVLALSSPIEPPQQITVEDLREAFVNGNVSWEVGTSNVNDLLRKRARPTSQASSEVRERELMARLDEARWWRAQLFGRSMSNYYNVTAAQLNIEERRISDLESLLAPSRQGAGGK